MSSRIASAHSELKAPLSPVTPSSERARMCFETSYRLALSCVASIPAFSSPLVRGLGSPLRTQDREGHIPRLCGNRALRARQAKGDRGTSRRPPWAIRTALLLQWRPSRRNDLPEILQPGLPPELGGDAGRACHEHRRVPGAARSHLDGDRSPGHRACHFDHLLHAIPRTAATEVV